MMSEAISVHSGTVDALVIGAGHAGLAVSHYLREHAIEHVILERGEIANSWRRERWDSLRLLTPNWQSRLPGYAYEGDDPDGFMDMREVADFIQDYAEHLKAPVQTQTEVTSVVPVLDGYLVRTNRGYWYTRSVVIASGACNQASVPALAESLPDSVKQITPMEYKHPHQLDNGGVLVVGASATGLQLAEEIQRSGRPVNLSVGEHVRMPRRYRGKDIQYWLDQTGLLDAGLDDVDDPERVRKLPSPQLVGSDEHRTLDLNALSLLGVNLVGRLAGNRDGRAMFSGSLRNVCAMADLKMNRLLDSIDEWIEDQQAEADPVDRLEATRVPEKPKLMLDYASENIKTVVWATGYRPDYSWLDVPVLDRKGRLRHNGGVVDAPGLYVVGLPFLRRRKSSFIHGANDDAREITSHLAAFLKQRLPLRQAV